MTWSCPTFRGPFGPRPAPPLQARRHLEASGPRGAAPRGSGVARLGQLLLLAGCGDAEPAQPPRPAFDPATAAPLCAGAGTPRFEDATGRAGLGHVHRTREGGFQHRNAGGGVVLEDLDGDGRLDLYLTNGAGPKALFLGRGDGTFAERTAAAGVAFPEDETLGVAAADYDNDGRQDLVLLNHGRSRLLRNRGDGTFEDVSERAGFSVQGVAAGASFGDLDGDGWLDVVVARLAEIDDFAGLRIRGARPLVLLGSPDGRFRAVDGSAFAPGSAYIASVIDLDQDGRPDLYVGEELGHRLSTNRIHRNLGGAIFADVTPTASTLPDAVMGLAILDLEGDGLPDLHATNLITEPPHREGLLRNQGAMAFVDETLALGASAMSVELARTVSWASLAFDPDNDGDEDLYVVYGHLESSADYDPVDRTSLLSGQPNALLERGRDGFSIASGSCAEEAGRGRGAAAGDVDGDGCEDLYVVNQGGPGRLLRNLCKSGGSFLELDLQGTRSNRDAIGATVRVASGGRTQHRFLTAGATSVHSSGPKRIHVGLGAAAFADELHVRWPSGLEERWSQVPAGRHRLIEGTASSWGIRRATKARHQDLE